jgi:DNA-binding NarL/FixJ family response regulator
MRVVLVGSPSRIRRLQARLPDGIRVVGEAATLSEARLAGGAPDAFLVTATGAGEDDLIEALTQRESEVLALLADGLPNKTIARRLEISDETVKYHLGSIFGKLGASNRTDAVRQALRRGLVPL